MQTEIQHSEVADDPHIAMRGIRVVFADERYNFVTDINGTRRSIVAYYSREPLNVSPDPERDLLLRPVCIEFFPHDDSGQTIVCQIGE